VDLLIEAGTAARAQVRELDRTAAPRGALDGREDANVAPALLPRGSGLPVLQDAGREVEQLGRELVAGLRAVSDSDEDDARRADPPGVGRRRETTAA